jgi:hypothetical protein
MNRNDIILMARDAGASGCANSDKWGILEISYESLERFAALVAAHEREACIAIAENKRHSPNFKLASIPPQNGTAIDIANLIRARGEK